MRTSNFLTLLCVVFFSSQLMAQQSIVDFKDFIEEHQGLDNPSGEFVPNGMTKKKSLHAPWQHSKYFCD